MIDPKMLHKQVKDEPRTTISSKKRWGDYRESNPNRELHKLQC